ncbi:MAG: hypothetical protein OXN16_02775 [Gammaproteobacteria bacterium]|nr:hypothetical protein [Gammaproteobacteria bacterium]
MSDIDNFLSQALVMLPQKPDDSVTQAKKRHYSANVSEKIALAFAAEFRRRGLKGTRLGPPGEVSGSGVERRIAGGIGVKRVDVSWATVEIRLALGNIDQIY